MGVEFQDPNEYEHQIVVTEEGECECGGFHEVGDDV